MYDQQPESLTDPGLNLTEEGIKFRYDVLLKDGTEIIGFYMGTGDTEAINIEEAHGENPVTMWQIQRVKDMQ